MVVSKWEINTINQMVTLDKDMKVISNIIIKNVPPKYKHLISGMEDCRIFRFRERYWFTCSTFEHTDPANVRLMLCRLLKVRDLGSGKEEWIVDHHVLLHGFRDNEKQKNWISHVDGEELYFIYSFCPFILLKCNSDTGVCGIHKVTVPKLPNRWRGGSKLVEIHSEDFDGKGTVSRQSIVLKEKDLKLRNPRQISVKDFPYLLIQKRVLQF